MNPKVTRAALRLIPVLALTALLASTVLSAQSLRVVPRIMFPRGRLVTTMPITVELSITDGNKRYDKKVTIQPGANQTTLKLMGVPRNRNYVVVARASNDSQFNGDSTVVLRAIIRKSQIGDGVVEHAVTINRESTTFADAVILYLDNTALALNEIDAGRSTQVEGAMDAILNLPAGDAKAEAERLSTVTVTGSVTDILGDPLEGIKVSAVDCTPSKLTLADGTFALEKVPVRCTSLRAYHEAAAPTVPRYIAQDLTIGPLTAPGGPIAVGTISLEPDPAAIPGDLRTAVALMADDTGDLAGWLSDSFNFVRAVPGEPPIQTKNKAEFILDIPPEYVEITIGSDFAKAETGTPRVYTFTATWTARQAATLWREKTAASGTITYGNKRWQLTSLTWGSPVILPQPPMEFAAVGGDGRAVLTWEAPADMDGVSGFQILRGASEDPTLAAPLSETLSPAARSLIDTVAKGTYHYWICSLEQYGGQTVKGPLTPMATAVVYDSFDTIKLFLSFAELRNRAGMESCLENTFSTTYGGAVMDKTTFVNWVLDTLFMTSDPMGGPTHKWSVDESQISKEVSDTQSVLRLKTYMVGRLISTELKYSRWVEGAQQWRVSASGSHLISWIGADSRKYYPAPAQPECTNALTADADRRAELRWSIPPDPDTTALDGFYILRSETDDWTGAVRLPLGGTTLSSATTTYTDSSIESGKGYYYWVIAVDKYGGTSKRPENMGRYVLVAGLPPDVRAIADQFLSGSASKNAVTVRAVTDDSCLIYQSNGAGNTWTVPLLEYVNFANFTLDPLFTYLSFRLVEVRSGRTGTVDYYEITYDCEGTWDYIPIETVTVTIEPILDGWIVTRASFRATE